MRKNYLVILVVLLTLAQIAEALTAGNMKYEVAVERIVVSCLDHKSPQVKVLNPASGTIVVIDCEREK